MKRLWNDKRGTSLIEILVVMVVLLVGIMTVVQMFPTGFGVVKAAESETIATKIALKELERWKNMSANLPTGILPIDDSGVIISDQDPGPPFTDWIKDGNQWKRGNVFNLRNIHDETTCIPVASYFQTGAGTVYGSRYTLAFSPIDVTDIGGGKLKIKSGDMRRRKADADSDPPYLRSGQYAIDYGDGSSPAFKIAFAPQPVDAVYYISYSYWAADSSNNNLRLVSVIDQRVPAGSDVIPANTSEWQTVPVDLSALGSGGQLSGYRFVEIEPDTDTCARGFLEVSNFNADDPYEYYLADEFLGIIAFNPVGRDMLEPTVKGMRPIEAKIDYRIYDLRILREDKVIAAPADENATTIPVKLALRFILNIDDPVEHPDTSQAFYKGLAPDLGITSPMLIIDLATGLRVKLTGTDPIDFKAGVVKLPVEAELIDNSGKAPNNSVKLAGRHLRFFYRADGDWTVQCQKAYAQYMRDWMDDPTDSSLPPDYCHYRLVSNGNGVNSRLKFGRTEYGKSVSVDYTYTLNNDASGMEHKVVGEAHTISNVTSSGLGAYADLNLPADATVKRIYAVVGTSFKVRVLWRDAKRWRYVDMDTNLVRRSD